MLIRRRPVRLLLLTLLIAEPVAAQSVITTRLDDPAAVYLAPEAFGARGDGVADDSPALQAAVDKAAVSPAGGILFIASGRYRVTRTIYIWRGVRVFGWARRGRCSCSATTRLAFKRASA